VKRETRSYWRHVFVTISILGWGTSEERFRNQRKFQSYVIRLRGAVRSINEFVDQRQKAWCIHCTRALTGLETNDDHVPSKSLLTKPFPDNLPTITICKQCNAGFSLDEQYTATFLSCVLAGSTESKRQSNSIAKRALVERAPLRARIERSKSEIVTQGGQTRIVWKPEIERIERVVLKNARGHVYFEYGEPMLQAPLSIRVLPLEAMTQGELLDFEGAQEAKLAAWPEVGSRMGTRLLTALDVEGQWVVVQKGRYRYSVTQGTRFVARSILSEYLASEVVW
jgi:hypothetical protein